MQRIVEVCVEPGTGKLRLYPGSEQLAAELGWGKVEPADLIPGQAPRAPEMFHWQAEDFLWRAQEKGVTVVLRPFIRFPDPKRVADDLAPLQRSDAEMAQIIAESYRAFGPVRCGVQGESSDGRPSVPVEKFFGVSGAAAKLAESGDPLFEPLKKFLGVTGGQA